MSYQVTKQTIPSGKTTKHSVNIQSYMEQANWEQLGEICINMQVWGTPLWKPYVKTKHTGVIALKKHVLKLNCNILWPVLETGYLLTSDCLFNEDSLLAHIKMETSVGEVLRFYK